MREGWRQATLDQLGRIITGKTPSTVVAEYYGGKVPFVSPSDMQGQRIIDQVARYLTQSGASTVKSSIVPARAVVVSCIGSDMGKAAILAHQSVTNQQINSILTNDDTDALFLYYNLSARKAEIRGSASGSAQPILNKSAFGRMRIDLPPLPKQRAIAATLGALDDKIELNRRMSETLEAMARALFCDWFVEFGPTRAKMEGTAPYLTPDLWSIFPDWLDDGGKPEGWEFDAVIDQADWINGAAYKNMHFSEAPDALPVIKIAELKNGVTVNTQWTATDLGPRYLIDDGELLFSWSGNPDTSIDTFIWSGGKAWLNQHIFAVRENGKRSKPFLHAMLKFLKPDFAELARNKQTTGLGHVTKADMQRMMICNAPPAIHQAFDSAISPIFERAFALQMESKTLAKTRDLLLPRLMSGESSVSAILAEG